MRKHQDEFHAIQTSDLSTWDTVFNPVMEAEIGRLMLRKDPETGAEIRMIRYPRGVINPAHTHPCGHGIFVLEGMLCTHKGDFGPRSWVWFPKGEIMKHGATEDGDVIGVFITDGEFDIFYEE